MRAACVLRDLLLVSHAIKARLHCIWYARDLTERESGGKDLDEDRLHHSRETAVAAWLHALSFINQPSIWPTRPMAQARATRLGPPWLAVAASAAASGVRWSVLTAFAAVHAPKLLAAVGRVRGPAFPAALVDPVAVDAVAPD